LTPCRIVVIYKRFGDPCCLHLQGENVGILQQHYTASRPRRPRLECSPPWKPQISQLVNCPRLPANIRSGFPPCLVVLSSIRILRTSHSVVMRDALNMTQFSHRDQKEDKGFAVQISEGCCYWGGGGHDEVYSQSVGPKILLIEVVLNGATFCILKVTFVLHADAKCSALTQFT
jgi:hypothetical protein